MFLYDFEASGFLRRVKWHRWFPSSGKDWDDLKKQLERGKNAEFWINKISKNRERDEEINKQLFYQGWTVIRFWGKDIKKDVGQCVKAVEEAIFEMSMEEKDLFD